MRASIGAGYITNLLVQHLDIAEKSAAFTVGLLHNVGRLVLLYNQPQDYTSLIESSSDFLPTIHEERDNLGIDHLSMGAIATQHWNFPELLPRLIESFEKPGHLSNPGERNLGLAIKTGVDYTHQLLAEIHQNPDLYQTEEDSEEINEDIFSTPRSS